MSGELVELRGLPKGFGLAYMCPDRYRAYVVAVMPLNIIVRCAIHLYSRLACPSMLESARSKGYKEGWAAAREHYRK
jgi:hypothetical protein